MKKSFLSFSIPFLLISLIFFASCGTSAEAVSSSEIKSVKESYNAKYDLDDKDDQTFSSRFTDLIYRSSYARTMDLIHTRLDVSFDWENSYLIGKAQLTLKPYFYDQDELVLDAKGFDLHEVSLVSNDGRKKLPYIYDKTKIYIDLERTFKRNEEFEVFIDYTAKPEELPKGGSFAIMEEKGLYFINPDGSNKKKPTQLWTQGETESNSCWFPTIDKPNERCTQELNMTVEKDLVTLSNGIKVNSVDNGNGTKTDFWKMDKPHAPYLFMMAVGDFAVVKDSWEGMEVNYYVDPEYAPYAKQIFGNTPEMMSFYSDVLGVKYPWPKYAQIVVEDFVSGAMENTTASVFYGSMHRTDREMLDQDDEDIVAHELFHHWFGDLVTCESWANIPLNEAFATYGEYLWIEHKYGRDEGDWQLLQDLRAYMMESRQKQVELIRFEYDDKEDMFDAHSYQKGGRILHMLRKYVGDDAFYASLKLYLEDNMYQSVEIHNLRLAFEEVTGQDLNWFFNQWFLNSGHPELEFSKSFSADNKELTVTIKQTQDRDETPVYILPIDIDVYSAGSKVRHRVLVTSREESFTFPLETRPNLVNIDAEKMLLAKIDDKKSTAEYLYQLRNAPLFLDRYDAVTYLSDHQHNDDEALYGLISALDDPSYAVVRKAIVSIESEDAITKLAYDKLKDLAQNHPESAVRSYSLSKLSEGTNPELMGLFEKALEDQAYSVVAVGIEAISDRDKKKGLELSERYQNEKSSDLQLAVMNIYASYGDDSHNDYFLIKLDEAGGFQQYFIMNTYTDFILRLENEAEEEKGLLALKEIAGNSSTWWVKSTAVGIIEKVRDKYKRQQSDMQSEGNNALATKVEKRIGEINAYLEELNQ